MKLTFFWDWRQKLIFISELKDYIGHSNTLNLACFGHWENKVRKDPVLRKFVDYLENNKMDTDCCLTFIRNCFIHFSTMKVFMRKTSSRRQV